MKTAALLAFAFLFALITPVRADERIRSFDSDITVNKDSSLTIAETITVNVEGIDIRRGIIREFPTRYQDERGDDVDVGFEVVSVKRDGRDEPWQVDQVSNGVEVRIGDPDVLLNDGIHTYVITYRTTFQLGYFPEGDQLFFNVTGNGWVFPIDKASATVRLPAGARTTRLAVYTGAFKSKDTDATIAETSPGVVVARTTQKLGSHEGLTVVVEWPTGFVDKPSSGAVAWRWLTDNISALFGLIGLLGSGSFLYWAWTKWGRDPPRGTIIPLFSPPDNMEPAEARFLHDMGYDNKIFAAAIVSMAVKGAVKIAEDPGWFSKTFKLQRTGAGAELLSPMERAAYDQLFQGSDEIELEQKNWQRIKAANDSVKARLQLAHVGKNFTENTGSVFGGIGILILAGLGIWATAGNGIAPFVGGAAIAAGVVLAILFANWMKAPTVAGQAMRDRIDGFRMFLDTAEKERWEVLNPPDMTPQLFEKYLPYALALDVDHTWSQTFEREMRIHDPSGSYSYQPNWYSGRNFGGIGAGALSHSISNAMSSAISSSSSPPGKSSGFGGGGFSGGGGGGGGGRGW
ncbi:hypothetical protein sos41_16130 [Alphaproteobacteria bacterium SO-S41]|nr:hypothetical protein sos41_16130 [Alphaproteobacteria bacterium SO-S41]